MKQLVFAILLFISTQTLVGQRFMIDTLSYDYGGESRTVYIYNPISISGPADSFDILYMLDGEWADSRLSTIESGPGKYPTISVAICNTDRRRDMLPDNDPTGFLAFIEEVLIPTLELKYRVRDRILFGHSLAGGFTINAMIMKPGLFVKYIASSPTPIMNFIAPDIYKRLDHVLHGEIIFYFSCGSKDIRQVRKWNAKLQEELSGLVFGKLKWKCEIFEDAKHSTSAYPALFLGMLYE